MEESSKEHFQRYQTQMGCVHTQLERQRGGSYQCCFSVLLELSRQSEGGGSFQLVWLRREMRGIGDFTKEKQMGEVVWIWNIQRGGGARMLAVRLDSILIDGVKIFVNLPSFEKKEGKLGERGSGTPRGSYSQYEEGLNLVQVHIGVCNGKSLGNCSSTEVVSNKGWMGFLLFKGWCLCLIQSRRCLYIKPTLELYPIWEQPIISSIVFL